MDPVEWLEMVERTRELEAALGSSRKFVAANEKETVVVQRRGVRAAKTIPLGHVINRTDLEVLRPCPSDCLGADAIDKLIGLKSPQQIKQGEVIKNSIYE